MSKRLESITNEPLYYPIAGNYAELSASVVTDTDLNGNEQVLVVLDRPTPELLAQFLMDSFQSADGHFSADDIKYWTDVLTFLGPDWASRIHLMISKMKWVA